MVFFSVHSRPSHIAKIVPTAIPKSLAFIDVIVPNGPNVIPATKNLKTRTTHDTKTKLSVLDSLPRESLIERFLRGTLNTT